MKYLYEMFNKKTYNCITVLYIVLIFQCKALFIGKQKGVESNHLEVQTGNIPSIATATPHHNQLDQEGKI